MRVNRLTVKTKEWGDVSVMRILPTKQFGSWGDFHFLQGTEWEKQILELDGNVFTDALHGRTLPFLNCLGTPYPQKLKKIPKEVGWCKHKVDKTCDMRNNTCYPCKKMADCYEPNGFGLIEAQMLAELVLFWREGGYVIRVIGKEFSLK